MPALSIYILSDFLFKRWLDNQYDRHFIPSQRKLCQPQTLACTVIQCVFICISSLVLSASSPVAEITVFEATTSEFGTG